MLRGNKLSPTEVHESVDHQPLKNSMKPQRAVVSAGAYESEYTVPPVITGCITHAAPGAFSSSMTVDMSRSQANDQW